jgi:A/G-specific adenine glycosylase
MNLPFGRTKVSGEELRHHIDTETAAEIVERGGVNQPEYHIDQPVAELPTLLAWLEENGRQYPWRQTTDPWRVYVSEILLQRTRGDAVAKIYDEFFSRFPGPETLNNATEKEIRNTVYSLGFVNHRTRTLREVGEIFCESHGCDVPDSIDELKRPWRVGTYSARACKLFAFGEPLALVDANFARVIGRVLNFKMPQQPHKNDQVYALMDSLVPSNPELARAFNFAFLDLGALVCTGRNPNCESCSINAACSFYCNEDVRIKRNDPDR